MDMHDMAMRMFGDSSPSNTTPAGSTMVDTPPTQTPTQVLYADEAPAPEPLPESAPRTNEELAQGMFAEEELPRADEPSDPDMVAIRREARMYSGEAEKAIPLSEANTIIGQTVPTDDGASLIVTKELALKATAEIRAMASDLSLSGEDINAVREAFKRSTALKNADEQTRIASREKAVDMLNREHGNEAARAFRAALSYVNKNPRVAAMLDKSGAGDDPMVVALIARKALQLHRVGKLKV